jgi:hypothetical protein
MKTLKRIRMIAIVILTILCMSYCKKVGCKVCQSTTTRVGGGVPQVIITMTLCDDELKHANGSVTTTHEGFDVYHTYITCK